MASDISTARFIWVTELAGVWREGGRRASQNAFPPFRCFSICEPGMIDEEMRAADNHWVRVVSHCACVVLLIPSLRISLFSQAWTFTYITVLNGGVVKYIKECTNAECYWNRKVFDNRNECISTFSAIEGCVIDEDIHLF